jgi:hypothetical protein
VTYGKRGNSRHVPLEHDALLGTDAATITGRVIDAEAGFRRWQV